MSAPRCDRMFHVFEDGRDGCLCGRFIGTVYGAEETELAGRTMIYVVAIPLGEDEDPHTVAVAISERVDRAADVIGNIRLGEASWEVSPLGVKAALLDVTSKARNSK